MGLDMYLLQRIYPNEKNKVKLTVEGKTGPIDPEQVSYTVSDAGYWRKANAVHGWFVENCQNGRDDCQEAEVTYEQFRELRRLCVEVIETKNHGLLPPRSGVFFGSTEIDEDYFDELRETIKIIDALDPDGDYYYLSSW